jgi:hypothetical protein
VEKGIELFATFPYVLDEKVKEYSAVISEFVAVSLAITSTFYRLSDAQDRYNEAVIAYEDRYLAPQLPQPQAAEPEEEDADEDEAEDAYVDVEVFMRDRKTRRNVLGVRDAVKSNKATKNHKLKPRSNKRDRTKTEDAKERTKSDIRSRASLDIDAM